MATSYKSEFSRGNGSLIESSALQVSISNNVALSLSAAVPFTFGSDIVFANNSFNDVALGTGGYVSANDVLPTKGYVDEAIAGITPGIPGDATYVDIAVPSAATFAVGDVLAFNASGVLALADANGEESSNALGVFLSKPSATAARVQVDGEVLVSTDLAGFTNGDLLFVAASAGAVTSYASLLSGEYATQVGIVSNKNDDKIILQQRIFGQVG
jgi:hypothetical protein